MAYVVSLTALVVLTIIFGFYFSKKPEKARSFAKKFFGGNIAVFVAILILAIITLFPTHVSAQTTTSTTGTSVTSDTTNNKGLGLLGAALSTGLSAIGAGIGVAIVGSAAVGAISEKPELLGRTLIYVGLAEGIVIYGLIVSIMILGRI